MLREMGESRCPGALSFGGEIIPHNLKLRVAIKVRQSFPKLL